MRGDDFVGEPAGESEVAVVVDVVGSLGVEALGVVGELREDEDV
jgi:hypothetical protein